MDPTVRVSSLARQQSRASWPALASWRYGSKACEGNTSVVRIPPPPPMKPLCHKGFRLRSPDFSRWVTRFIPHWLANTTVRCCPKSDMSRSDSQQIRGLQRRTGAPVEGVCLQIERGEGRQGGTSCPKHTPAGKAVHPWVSPGPERTQQLHGSGAVSMVTQAAEPTFVFPRLSAGRAGLAAGFQFG